MILPDYRYSECVHLQGKHCTKIGSKCIEKRWFNSSSCLIKLTKRMDFIPKPPSDNSGLGVACGNCAGVWGECEHSKDY